MINVIDKLKTTKRWLSSYEKSKRLLEKYAPDYGYEYQKKVSFLNDQINILRKKLIMYKNLS